MTASRYTASALYKLCEVLVQPFIVTTLGPACKKAGRTKSSGPPRQGGEAGWRLAVLGLLPGVRDVRGGLRLGACLGVRAEAGAGQEAALVQDRADGGGGLHLFFLPGFQVVVFSVLTDRSKTVRARREENARPKRTPRT